MKRTVVVLFLAVGLVGAMASPALATYYGNHRWDWTHGGCTASERIIVNEHDVYGWIEGLSLSRTSCGTFSVEISDIWLYRNSNLIQHSGGFYFSLTSSWKDQSTPWNVSCYGTKGVYQAKVRFQFHHADGHLSGWTTLWSGTYTRAAGYDCPF